MRMTRLILFISFLTILLSSLAIGQKSSAANHIPAVLQNVPTQTTANISFDINDSGTTINPHVLGTNLPAWLATSRTLNSTFINRTIATDSPLLRIPGGSWSNYYNWEGCENRNDCPWTWGVLKPTDFINFFQATNTEGMYTVNMNGTAKEAAALVAFFNGSVNDDTVIGTDVNNRNWGKVSDWAKLRSEHGNPDPFYIKYWEIGNEIYGGKSGQGKDCAAWGWEDVWTCDGREYVLGKGNHEGFIAFRNEMRTVDPSIMVGAVGVPNPDGWSNWGNEVIEEAGDVMDFYIIHKYGFGGTESNMQTMLAEPQGSWQTIRADIDAAFDTYAGGRRVPIAVTEYNLFAVEGKDVDERMSQAVNGLYIADTIGQMMQHGFDIANQWDLAHGDSSVPSRYGLMRANTFFRSPQYYVFPLWSRFGSEMLPISSSYNAATQLSVYAGRIDDTTYSVMAINKTGNQITASIEVAGGSAQFSGVSADVAKANSLNSTSVTFNGKSDPNDSLSNAPSTNLGAMPNPMSYSFAPYSITLLRLEIDPSTEPVITQLSPPFAGVNESSVDKLLTVSGYNFTVDCVVRWDSSDLVTTYVSPTRLTAVIPAANISSPDTAAITVHNPIKDETSAPQTFTVVSEVKWVYLPFITK